MNVVRQHADDAIRLVVEAHIASDDAVDAARLLLGERVAEDRDLVAPRLPSSSREQAPAQRRGAQDAEERRRDVHRRHAFGRAALPDAEAAPLIERVRIEDLSQLCSIDVVRHRRAGAFDTRAGKGVVGDDEAARFGVRQRPEQNRLDDGKERAVGADAEGQGDDRGDREAAVLDEHPEGEFQVLAQCVHGSLGSDRVARVRSGSRSGRSGPIGSLRSDPIRPDRDPIGPD